MGYLELLERYWHVNKPDKKNTTYRRESHEEYLQLELAHPKVQLYHELNRYMAEGRLMTQMPTWRINCNTQQTKEVYYYLEHRIHEAVCARHIDKSWVAVLGKIFRAKQKH